MTFEELVAEVNLIVKRPDLLGRVQSAVKAAILKTHQVDFFYRDLIEVPIIFTVERTLQLFDPYEVIPNFRKVKYVRLWHGGADGVPGKFLKHIHIENALDGYGYQKSDVFYMAGQRLQVRCEAAVKTVLFGCYVHPKVVPENELDSWIAREHPYTIIYDAAMTLFRSIGFLEQAGQFAALRQEELSKLLTSNVDEVPTT